MFCVKVLTKDKNEESLYLLIAVKKKDYNAAARIYAYNNPIFFIPSFLSWIYTLANGLILCQSLL